MYECVPLAIAKYNYEISKFCKTAITLEALKYIMDKYSQPNMDIIIWYHPVSFDFHMHVFRTLKHSCNTVNDILLSGHSYCSKIAWTSSGTNLHILWLQISVGLEWPSVRLSEYSHIDVHFHMLIYAKMEALIIIM